MREKMSAKLVALREYNKQYKVSLEELVMRPKWLSSLHVKSLESEALGTCLGSGRMPSPIVYFHRDSVGSKLQNYDKVGTNAQLLSDTTHAGQILDPSWGCPGHWRVVMPTYLFQM